MSELIFLFGQILTSFDDSSYFKECEVRSLTEKDEQRSGMFRNRVFRKIFGFLGNEITIDRYKYKKCSEELYYVDVNWIRLVHYKPK